MPGDLVLVHGAGRSGSAAWTGAWREGARALDLSGALDVREAAELVAAAIADATVLVAHSHGAIPAVLALTMAQPRRLVLVEPALYDVARGHPAVEAHVEALDAAHRALEDGGLEAFWRIARPRMLGGPFEQARWEHERATASWLAGVERPWGHGIAAADACAVPAAVVTGAWNAEYDAIAEALAAAGAEHVVLPGAGHRPHDLPAFEAVLDDA